MGGKIEIGVCCSPKDAARLPPEACDFIEVNAREFLVPEKGEDEFKANLEAGRRAAKPIRSVNSFLPGDLKCVGPDADEERLVRYAETAFRRAGQAGVEIIVFGAGVARRAPEGYPREQAMEDVVKVLRRIGPMANRHGVTIVVEPLNREECNVINSLAEGAKAVEGCAQPNVWLLADYYHMLKDGEPATEIVRYGHLIRHTHVSELAGRGFPGKSREDFGPFFRALQEADYAGRVALECGWGDIATEVDRSVRYLRE